MFSVRLPSSNPRGIFPVWSAGRNCHYVDCSRKVQFLVGRNSLRNRHCLRWRIEDQAPLVQTLDSAIHRIKIYPVDNAIGFPNTYPLDSDLSGRYRYPTFKQPAPVVLKLLQNADNPFVAWALNLTQVHKLLSYGVHKRLNDYKFLLSL